MVTLQVQPRRETMTSVERMSAITRGDRPDRIPVLPFTGGFCASIVGYPIRSIYDNPEKSFWAQIWAQELLGYDGVPSFWYASYGGWEFGGEIRMPQGELDQAPVLTRFRARTPEEVEALEIPDVETAGHLPLHIEFAEIQRQFGVPVMVPAWGPFTAAANIVGVDVLCRWMIRQPPHPISLSLPANSSRLSCLTTARSMGIWRARGLSLCSVTSVVSRTRTCPIGQWCLLGSGAF